MAASVQESTRPTTAETAIAAAREAWAEIYAQSLQRGKLPDGIFNLFIPTLDTLTQSCDDPVIVERLAWYRRLFTTLEEKGLGETGALIQRAGDVLEQGGNLSDA